jgi:hypothetical protein
MHNIEPHYTWERQYRASEDRLSPLYGKRYDFTKYSSAIYDHYIHPAWDYIGSETLYIKVLYVNYPLGFAIIEMLGEWNDAINNDIMHLKRNILDAINQAGIKQYILIGENVLNFHASDDSYYEEWFDDVEDGWIAAINFRHHVENEWKKYHLDYYINFGGTLHIENWRTITPMQLFNLVKMLIVRRLG